MDSQPSSPTRNVALALSLSQEIASGKYVVGARFPTEQELQVRFGVGRHTVREALKILTEQGLLGRRRKTGTVVLTHRPVSHYVQSLRNIRSLLDFAQSTTLQIRHEGFGSLSDRDSENLRGLPDKRWFRIAGLRSARSNGEPLCWSEILVPERFAPSRDEVRRGERPVYEIVMQQYNMKLDHVEQEITAMALPSRVAGILRAESGMAALMVKRYYVTQAGTTFEVSQNLYPADRYSITSIIRQRL